VARLASAIEAAGMEVVHPSGRRRGSSVVSVHDPSAVLQKMLKKKNHGAFKKGPR
jgi:hypothetical protein